MVKKILSVIIFILFTLSLLPQSQINIYIGIGGSDYGYEFPQMPITGVNSTVIYYNISVSGSSPSTQQNTCILINKTQVFVQNVLWYYGKYENPEWGIEIWYHGSLQIAFYMTPTITGNKYTLITLWNYNKSGVLITFYLSNGTETFNETYYIPGKYNGLFNIQGTVIVGYGNGATAYLAPGFNVSISTTVEIHGKWYTPPVIFSGLPNTGENAVCGRAYLSTNNRVFVVYNNTNGKQIFELQFLALPSVIIFGDEAIVFPFDSLWEIKYPNGSVSFFVNETKYVEGAIVCPYGITNLPYQSNIPNVTHFKLEKKYHVVYDNYSFWVPQKEYVFILINNSYVPILIDNSTTISNSSNTAVPTATTTVTQTSVTTVTSFITVTHNSYITIHEITTVTTTVFKNVYNSSEFYIEEIILLLIILGLVLYLLIRNKK
ncbi:hypothetical protein [Sulfurisphaera tokodaii]|uniref:Thermopsin n=2 Tax=Sulfurisphaera tokodaii TaxID=111955 RepID=Q973C4_SULTO|nr:hypothetical protein [Sulfurisphaera tokodaii]BAB65989.1 hypothetical protein STK_09690 [Sulfurisphaera tokodaii str. 7]HII73952.1 hypothetical protein [Sulfurisphaera tokodaii]